MANYSQSLFNLFSSQIPLGNNKGENVWLSRWHWPPVWLVWSVLQIRTNSCQLSYSWFQTSQTGGQCLVFRQIWYWPYKKTWHGQTLVPILTKRKCFIKLKPERRSFQVLGTRKGSAKGQRKWSKTDQDGAVGEGGGKEVGNDKTFAEDQWGSSGDRVIKLYFFVTNVPSTEH